VGVAFGIQSFWELISFFSLWHTLIIFFSLLSNPVPRLKLIKDHPNKFHSWYIGLRTNQSWWVGFFCWWFDLAIDLNQNLLRWGIYPSSLQLEFLFWTSWNIPGLVNWVLQGDLFFFVFFFSLVVQQQQLQAAAAAATVTKS
jgi:hypothetical protein